MRRFLAALTPLFCTVVLAGADWPQFRGADTTAVADDADIPVDVGKAIRWTVDLPGRGLSCPIVVGNRVYLTASTGYADDRLHVLCFEADSGRRVWERQFWATGRTLSHPKMCNASPTMASDGQRLFAFFSSNDLVGLDLDGNLLWYRGLTHDYKNASNSLGMASSPVVVGKTLVVQAENDSESLAVGINPENGENRWKHDRPILANWASPTILRGKAPEDDLVVLQAGTGLSVLRPYSGVEVWSFAGECDTIASTAIADGILYAPCNGLTALRPDPAGGKPTLLWKSARLAPITPTALVYRDRVFSIGASGVFTCGDVEKGRNLWQMRLLVEGTKIPSSGMFSATPVAAGGHVFIVNEEGVLMVIEAAAEKGKIIAHHDFGETILATPAIAGGAMYLRSDKHLWKIAK